MTSFPPLGLEYVAAAMRPHAERIDLVNFRHERTPSSQPFLNDPHLPGAANRHAGQPESSQMDGQAVELSGLRIVP